MNHFVKSSLSCFTSLEQADERADERTTEGTKKLNAKIKALEAQLVKVKEERGLERDQLSGLRVKLPLSVFCFVLGLVTSF